MTSISVTLIRGTHSDFDVENLEALRIIRLNNQGIVCIDNLEVFSHITELHLADNGITTIENIDFLDNLAFLDLSNNLISSDSLISSIGLMPKNIKTINLSGNPCANDDSALIALSDSCPGLDIIVGVYAGGEIIDAAENSGLENTNKKVDFSHQNNEDENQSDGDDQKDSDAEENDDGEEGDMPLNADEVLKSLVERKCRLQSLEMFSVTRTTEELDSEFQKAVQVEAERSMKRRLLLQIKSSELSSLDSFQKRLHDIKTDSTDESSIGDFRSRLREAAKCAHEAIQAGVGTSQVQEEKE